LANDTTEPFLCDKFSHILVAAFASASNDVASDGFFYLIARKDQQSFSWASNFTDCPCLLEMV
jgi:hypothetical protein